MHYRFARLTQMEQVEDDWGFTPLCQLEDSERFKDCLPLKCICSNCKEESEVVGILASFEKDGGASSLTCTNCGSRYYGRR